MAGAKSAGNAALACGYEGSTFQAVSWLGQSPQATLRSPAVMKVRLFKPFITPCLLARMGLIFVTAGERSVACGSAKAPKLPEWAKLLCVFVLPIRAVVACTFRCPQATLRSPCGYEGSAF
ncbi:MAG: hypothetical protein LBG92_08030 [Prevotellaceae bacterium]|jgi:uncharacterized membrane protein|nr:hypothetical protein [Prevotellaceae bacterium]